MEYELTVIVTLVMFSILDVIFLINTIRHLDWSDSRRCFLHFAVSVVLQQIFGILTQISGPDFNKLGNVYTYFAYSGSLVTMTASSYYWYCYLRLMICNDDPKLLFWRIIRALPVAVILLGCLASPMTHWVYYVDADGTYQRGSLFFLQIICPYSYLLMLFVVAIQRRKDNKSDKNRLLRFFFSFMIPSMVGVCIQMFIVKGAYSTIGISIGLFLMYLEIFFEDVTENRRLKSMEPLIIQLQEVNKSQEIRIQEVAALNACLQENQEQLENARIAAEAASAAKTVFLNNMSHDIRTPLNAILGYTDIGISHIRETEKVTDSFRKIKTAGDHLLSLINDILEMSRIESGKLILMEHELDVLKAIEGIDTMGQALALPKNIDFHTVIGDIPNPYIYADELHINEILINLISNAVKYTPAGGWVRYTVNQLGPVQDGKAIYRFEISDNGIGMSEEFQSHLYEAFSREASSTVSKIEGAGLGLSIVKNIVDLVGGTIQAVSRPHEGTVFTAEIPFRVLTESEIGRLREERSQAQERLEDSDLRGMRVLLVDDNEINREIAVILLEDSELVVETAADGAEAVKALEDKGMDYYDFVLMDIQMPVMDGYAATKAIRQLPGGSGVRIIALSANAFEEDRRLSAAAGMNAHVAKPIDTDELFMTMKKLL